jgi:hypothetical protein
VIAEDLLVQQMCTCLVLDYLRSISHRQHMGVAVTMLTMRGRRDPS